MSTSAELIAASATNPILQTPESGDDAIDGNLTEASISQEEGEAAQMLIQVAESAENDARAGLFGGSPALYEKLGLKGGRATLYQKLGLKGGGRIRLGLFGGSPIANQTQSLATYSDGDDIRSIEREIRGQISENQLIEDEGDAGVTTESEEPDGSIGNEDGYDEIGEESEQQGKIESEAEDGEFEGHGSEDKPEDEGYQDAGAGFEAVPPKFEPKFDSSDPLFDDHETQYHFNIDTVKKLAFEEVENKPVVIPDDQWYTVGFFKGTSALVKDYFLCTDDGTDLNVDDLPDSNHVSRIALEPGAVYKFRVAAINTVGRSEWSPVSFKTFFL